MTLQYSDINAPHLNRSVLIAPGRRINLAGTDHPLARIAPRTRLGALALNLSVQSSIATIQIIATSTYVNALTALAAPAITFTAPPPGTHGITVQQLQSSWQSFVEQLAALQGRAMAWIATSPGSGASIFSNLVSVAGTIGGINATVQSQFTLLQTLPPGSSEWQKALTSAKSLVGVEIAPLASLGTQIETLSTNLGAAASMLTSAASTGVLQQLQTAYQNEIDALKQDITNCNNTISSDNSKIVGLGFAAGAAIVVGIVGLLNFWNPIGWIMIAGGAAGAYFAIAEIEALKGEIAILTQKIKNDTATIDTDRTAAQTIAAFAQSAQAAANMNSAAQQELNTLIQLCTTLGDEMTAALNDLNQDEIADALTEWNEVVAAAAFLGGITAYIWPGSIQLANPTNLSATGNSAYLVSNSGTVYQYQTGGNSWSALPGSSLSVVSGSGGVFGIDGAPADGSHIEPTPYGLSFLVKAYANGAWTNISTFPAAQIATDGQGHVWAINQTMSDRQAYRYGGSSTGWSALGPMPNSDAPGDIAGCNGKLFAIANNGRGLWAAGGSGWTQIGTATYAAMDANGGWLGLVDTGGNGWVIDTTATSPAPQAMMTGLSLLAQAPNGDQYVTDSSLNLWHVAYVAGQSPSCTQLRANIVGIAVSDGGTVYATDNSGNVWVLTAPATNSWQLLPALPS
ncbi:hypothetical protein GVO57_08625 [Sphingomonas changnyeongensis]|uniref:Uncharacterized protein n=1 Tax=Sphingomonas changnyeongensis TaxID=2698679 RepID=A0A7Z2S5A6_9SPHN|nr:hypothetical protein [Sphingomonas changnyeongensis]QHL90870.1 hypothetical protein GVO57_08625 [Sphingomonas changnyeongensis]